MNMEQWIRAIAGTFVLVSLGGREALARPEAKAVDRKFPTKVKGVSAKHHAGGGCG